MSGRTGWMWARQSGSGSIAHKLINGVPVPYWEIPLPTGLGAWFYRVFHRCYAQTKGVFGWEVVERCPCGGVRFADLPATEPRGSQPTCAYQAGPWIDRNSLFTGDAWAYMGGMRPLEITEGGV